ncbi:uncharacterized protein LOC110717941 [Chenopodium quinoa]|uniref:Uncharacterized protein n=1 Tax=Chenopodium quinoa TaxID=63459 RepID=A0A803KTV2_CHEQI|nr:uncharacterized protein LOC110717941 [Chenopodium quinoa]
MACKRGTSLVWMMVVVVAAILVAENGRMCSAFDLGEAKEAVLDKAEEAKDWAYNKISGSGKLSVNPQNMKQAAEDMMHDGTKFASGKVHTVSHSVKDGNERFYAEAKRDAGPAYDSMATKTVRED